MYQLAKVLVLALLLNLQLLISAQQWPDCDSTTPNTIPFFTGEPEFVRNTTNGKLYRVGADEPKIYLIHVYGEPYEMGYAHGSMLKAEINSIVSQVEEYIDEQIEEYLNFLPKWLQDIIAKFGAEAALDATFWATESYIPSYFIDEMKGIADGAGIDYMRIVRVHMLPELIKAQCSMMGAWGPAVAQTNQSLVQLRALDWTTNGPFQQFPAVIVYHPKSLGHSFAIVTWTGFVGAITGFSSEPLGLCEKVWLSYNGTDSRIGIPFHFLLRDILQFDKDIDSAISRVANAHRTCSIWVGLGDDSNQFRAIAYSHQRVDVYDDKNFPAYPPAHPLIPGVVFINKHVQPSQDRCMGYIIQKFYGQIDPSITKGYITAFHQTGNMHIAIYDFKHGYMYVANASPYVNGAYTPAWDRTFVRFDMNALFSESL